MNTIPFLKSALRQFEYYKKLGEGAMLQVSDEALHWQPNEESNSIATIVKHLWGNMLSRWTNFLTEDGEKSWRQRDAEFDNDILAREAVMQKWQEGWDCLFQALNSITDADLEKIIYIRNEGHSIMEAINRQLCHYPYHVGQIVYIAKMVTNGQWNSLSIPKNKSGEFNQGKFSQEKSVRHFTESEMNKKQ